MHVVFIATPDLSYISGSSLSLQYTVEALSRRGVECTVLCQRAPEQGDSPGVRYIQLPMPLDYQVITDSTPSSTELAECLNQLVAAAVSLPEIDLIHAIYGTFTGVAATVVGALRDTPVVVSTFGRDLTLGAVVDTRYRNLMRISYGRADLIVAADSMVAELANCGYAGAHTEICVLPPGMNFTLLEQAAQQRRGRRPGNRLLAVQSSFNEKKGLGILLDALALVSPSAPDVELVVVGHDDTPGCRIEAKLRSQADRLGVSDRVRFVGHLTHTAALKTMAECDVLVDPRTINSFSSCLYEGMVMGLPVVASDVPCNRDALGDGSRGVLTRPEDPDDLAAGIRRVLHDEAYVQSLRAAAHAYAATAAREFDCSVIAERLHQRYQALCAKPSTAEAGRGLHMLAGERS